MHHRATSSSSFATATTSGTTDTPATTSPVDAILPKHHHVLTPNHSLLIQRLLGKGSFGQVYLAYSITDNRLVAIKHIPKATDPSINILCKLEAYIHRMCSEKAGKAHVVELLEAWQDESTSAWWMVMEYMPHGDLFHYCVGAAGQKEWPAAERWSIFCDVVAAVAWCHSLGVSHLDLKYVLLYRERSTGKLRAKLADFGLATMLEQKRAQGSGSMPYMPPESALPSHFPQAWTHDDFRRLSPIATIACDVWALGVILINLVTGMKPWEAAALNDPTYASVQQHGTGVLRDLIGLPEPVCRMLDRMVFTAPKKRCASRQLLEWARLLGPDVMMTTHYPSDADEDVLWSEGSTHKTQTATSRVRGKVNQRPPPEIEDDSGIWSTATSLLVW